MSRAELIPGMLALPQSKLVQLYGTREAYLEKFNRSIGRLVAYRWITADDGSKLKAEEAAKPQF